MLFNTNSVIEESDIYSYRVILSENLHANRVANRNVSSFAAQTSPSIDILTLSFACITILTIPPLELDQYSEVNEIINLKRVYY